MCQEVLFSGAVDPMDVYVGEGSWTVHTSDGKAAVAEGGGWPGPPLAVRLSSWRSLWRRKWYHQKCCGVYHDQTNRAGQWHVFGGFPIELYDLIAELQRKQAESS